MTFTVKANFIGSFKTGDNIVYNLLILKVLYEQYEKGDDATKALLHKPIIVWLMSITEAILHDFHSRTKSYTTEGVAGLQQDVLDYLRGKKIDQLGSYISSARKHDFFNLGDTSFYERLEELRKIRNRVHIQNIKKYLPKDEDVLFDINKRILAEKCTEVVAKTMSRKYPRSPGRSGFVSDFEFPWQAHFPRM